MHPNIALLFVLVALVLELSHSQVYTFGQNSDGQLGCGDTNGKKIDTYQHH